MRYETLRKLRFGGPFAKLDRADEHLGEFREILDTHMRRPDLIVGTIGYDPGSGQIYPRYRVQGVPTKLLVVAGDIVHNLRSALDQTVWQLVVANEGQPSFRTDFPIYISPRRVQIAGGVGSTSQRLVEAQQPFNAHPWQQPTAQPLAKLQHISNIDKHRMLVRGRQGIQQLLITAGKVDPAGSRWEGRIVLGDLEARGRALTLVPLPGSDGEIEGSAWYEVDIEYAPPPKGSEAPHNFDDLLPTLTDLVGYTRTLVGRLVATVWPDHVSMAQGTAHQSR